jgi:histidyl-tRNA synthetase
MLDHPEVGSICSGGRYDNLAEYYTDKSLPGVGISIGLTRLFYVLNECHMLSDQAITAPADVLVIPMTEDLTPAIALATQLRDQGIRTQIYAEQKKTKAKLSYCDRLGIPYALLLGEDEIREDKVTLKTLATGQQVTVPLAEAMRTMKLAIWEARQGVVIQDTGKKD